MSADSDPVKDPAKNHSTKADPAVAERLLEEFFKIQSATSDSYRIADLAKDAPKPLLDTVRRRPGFLWRSYVCPVRLAAIHIQGPASLSRAARL